MPIKRYEYRFFPDVRWNPQTNLGRYEGHRIANDVEWRDTLIQSSRLHAYLVIDHLEGKTIKDRTSAGKELQMLKGLA